MSNDNLKKKLALHAIDPGLAQIHQSEEVSQLLNKLIEKVSENKHEGRKATSIKIKGNVIKGEPGRTPVLGVDYFTEEDKKEIIKQATPRKGIDYFTDREVEYIADLAKPEFGVDYFTDREIAVIKRELKPVPGVDFEVPKDGYSPEKGVDYFTTKDKKEIVSELTKKIPQAEKVNYDKIVAETLRHIPAPVFPESAIKEESIDSIIDKLNKKKGVLSVEVLKSLPYDMLHGSKREVGLTRSAVTGGSTGAVDSVNGQTGVVVLDTGDIAEATDANYVSDAQLVVIGNTSGTNTGDNATNTQYSGLAASKQDVITGLTASGAELNILDGATLTTTELNYVDGVTSSIQTQLNSKLDATAYDDATSAETNTGTSTVKYVSPDGLAGSYAGTKSVSIQVFDGATDVATGDGKAYITIPEALNGMNLVRAQATVVTAGTTNATTVMIHNKTDAADMLSGAISIASAGTVGTVGTINTATDDVATNDVLRIDVDSVSTTAPKGLIVILEFRLP